MTADQLRHRIAHVLSRGYLMSLATHDEGGPWCADVIHVHDDELVIYWMSDPDTRHSAAIETNGAAAATITVSGPGEMNLGVQITGVAERIAGSRHDLALLHFAKRNKPAPAEHDDVLQGDAWYMLRPTFIELIDEERLGFEKQKLTL